MRQTRTKVISWLLVLVMAFSLISPGSMNVAKAEETTQNTISDAYAEKLGLITSYLKKNAETPEAGYEWVVMQQARYGTEDAKWYHTYYDALCKSIAESENGSLGSIMDNAKAVIALSAIGADPANVEGKNLLSTFADYSAFSGQYVTAFSYALLALDTRGYAVPETDAADATTRDKLIKDILANFTEEGYIGYEWDGVAYSDMDSTAMVLQALAPYNNDEYPSVKTLVNKSVEWISGQQGEDGAFGEYDKACTTAQVVCALSELGIDADTDSRFVKNGNSALDALLSYCDNEGCVYMSSTYNKVMSTEQAAYALTAYSRMKNNQNRLFDMTDAVNMYHTGGEATCTAKAVCDMCGTAYGECNDENHKNTEIKDAKEATCTAEGYTGDTCCKDCGEKISTGNVTEKKAHTVVVDPAVAPTETTAGKTEGSHCSVCNQVIVAQTEIAATGAANSEEAVKKPAKTSIKSVVSKKKKQIKVTWKKKSGVTGYQIQVSTSSKFKKSKTKTYKVAGAKKTSKTIKSLKSNRKYYVRIRTYKTVETTTEKCTTLKNSYSRWSGKKTIKVK